MALTCRDVYATSCKYIISGEFLMASSVVRLRPCCILCLTPPNYSQNPISDRVSEVWLLYLNDTSVLGVKARDDELYDHWFLLISCCPWDSYGKVTVTSRRKRNTKGKEIDLCDRAR